MIAIKKFKYANFMSTDFSSFDLICDCAFDSDDGGVTSYLSREAVSSESYRGDFKRVHNLKYTETLTLQVTLLRGDFAEFSMEEQRKIFAWLTSKNTATMIDFYDDIGSNTITFSILGMPTEIESYKLANNRTVGYIITFESVNPWALSPLQTTTQIITTPQTFTINCDTDEYNALLYPKVVITEGNSIVVEADHAMTNQAEHLLGTVYHYDGTYYWIDDTGMCNSQISAPTNWNTTSVLIENLTTNHQTVLKGNTINEIITLDGANRVVSSDATNRIMGNDFNWQWLPLQKGSNTIKVTGNCEISIQWREPRKVGEW